MSLFVAPGQDGVYQKKDTRLQPGNHVKCFACRSYTKLGDSAFRVSAGRKYVGYFCTKCKEKRQDYLPLPTPESFKEAIIPYEEPIRDSLDYRDTGAYLRKSKAASVDIGRYRNIS